MSKDKLQTPQQSGIRRTLRWAGLAVFALGGLLILVGVGSFFAAFGSMGPPHFFWCAFLGMPLLFFGGAMTMFGFLGAMQRYVAAESAPVAKDVVNYMGENVQPGVKSVAKAFTEGVKEGLDVDRKQTR
jgi:hypothetical protein